MTLNCDLARKLHGALDLVKESREEGPSLSEN